MLFKYELTKDFKSIWLDQWCSQSLIYIINGNDISYEIIVFMVFHLFYHQTTCPPFEAYRLKCGIPARLFFYFRFCFLFSIYLNKHQFLKKVCFLWLPTKQFETVSIFLTKCEIDKSKLSTRKTATIELVCNISGNKCIFPKCVHPFHLVLWNVSGLIHVLNILRKVTGLDNKIRF